MPSNSRSKLIERLLETLSLAEHYEEQNPPSPITRAALRQTMQELIAELKIISTEPSADEPNTKTGRG